MRRQANPVVDGGSSKATYRRDIDGLRAVAVLAVIGFHAGMPGFSGGYVGVDVFFVISGFVITSLIGRELEAGRFSLRRFYERRFRRLMPALSLVLLACLLPAWYWMLPDQLVAFATSVAALLLLAPNVFFWRNTSYFNAASDDHPLLHTWSLGIEEQFYVGFAVLLLLTWRLGRNRTTLVMIILCLVSLILCEVTRRHASVAAFYLLPFRAWELLAGAVAASWLDRRTDPHIAVRSPPVAVAVNVLPWIGVVALAGCLVGFDASTPFPSLWTLVPVLATSALLLAPAANPVSRALASRPLVALGLVSYSAYLWHYPVFVFAKLAWLQAPNPLTTTALVAFVFAAAGLSWRYVEQPARRIGSSFAAVAAGVAGCLTVVCAFCWAVWSHEGMPERLSVEARRLLSYADSKNPRQRECLMTSEHEFPLDQSCTLGKPGVTASVALIGDSHADALFPALDAALLRQGLGARFMAYSGCPPVPGIVRVDVRDQAGCNAYFTAVYRQLASHPEIDTVVVTARWSTYLEGEVFDNQGGGRESGKVMVADALAPWSTGESADRAVRVGRAYRQGIERLLAMGKRVVLVYPIPEVGWDVPHWLAQHEMRGRPLGQDLSTSRAVYEHRNLRLTQAFDPLAAAPGRLFPIRPVDVFCGLPSPERCQAQAGGVPLYYDNNHLSLPGANKLVAAISKALGWQSAEIASAASNNDLRR